MRFVTEQLIAGVPYEQYERLFFLEALNEAICADLHMARTLLARSEVAGTLKRRVSIVPQRKVPAALQRFVDPARMSYVEHMEYVFGSGEAQWEIVPTTFADKVTARGCVRFTPHTDGCLRRVEGEVQIRIMGIGKLVERFIVEDIERSFARAAAFTARWFARHGLPEDDGDAVDVVGDEADVRDATDDACRDVTRDAGAPRPRGP